MSSKIDINEVGAEDAKWQSRARRELFPFITYTFPKFSVNWHHIISCQYLDKLARGEITRLMILMPPRHSKSELVSRRFPAYMLGRNPDEKIISCSYSAALASAMNRDVQRIIDSEEYQRLFPATKLFGANVRSVASGTWLRNSDIFEIVDRRGYYRSAGIGGSISGHGFSTGLCDDPCKNQKEALSKTWRDMIWEWYSTTFLTRMDEESARICITMTLWHEDDLVGRILDLAEKDPEADQWTVVRFPAIAEDDVKKKTYMIPDPRKPGEALWPEKKPLKMLIKLKKALGEWWFALFQQRPSSEKGNKFQKIWWQYYKELPERFDRVIQTWDLTFEGKETSAYNVGYVLGKIGADVYIIDEARFQGDVVDQMNGIRQLSAVYPYGREKIIEKAANAAAVIRLLKKEIPGLIARKVEGSKEFRAEAAIPYVRSGNVYLPDKSIARFDIDDYIDEMSSFPKGKYKDRVDATSQGLIELYEGTGVLPNLSLISMDQKSTWSM